MTRRLRGLLGFAAAQALAVGLLTGLVDAWTYRATPLVRSHDYLDPARSGTAALVGARYVEWVAVPLALVLYLLLPFAVAVVVSRRDDRPLLLSLAWAVAAVLVVPLALLSTVLLITAAGDGRLVWPIVAVVVGVSAVLVAMHRVALARSPDDVDRRPPLAVFANIAFIVLFVAGLWLGIMAAGPAGALVEREDGGVPQVAFETAAYETDDGTVLVITHDGGDAVPAEYVRIDGEGFDDVSGVDRPEPGSWPASEATDRDGEAVVTAGDSVTVGVADGCDIRVIYVRGSTHGTLDRHDCGEA